MKVLGCIREIQLTELVVSLPNSLTGHVPITSIHDVLTERLQKAFSNISVEDEVIFKPISVLLESYLRVKVCV